MQADVVRLEVVVLNLASRNRSLAKDILSFEVDYKLLNAICPVLVNQIFKDFSFLSDCIPGIVWMLGITVFL